MTGSPAELTPFDLTGPLPSGTTLLEASAGTGKTYTVAALVARYVAEGVARLDELLVITFGRAASQELRERVREHLLIVERALADPASADPDHAYVGQLLDVDAAELARRRQRLRDALAEFDTATIATTHQFCHLVLRSLGVAGDTEAGAALVENLDELVEEVVDDLYLQRFGDLAEAPPFDRGAALTLAYAAVGDPQAALTPADPDPDTAGGARVAFALAVRAEVERRKQRLGILSYDDLLGRLAEALADPAAPARDRMRSRWRIVLVDEFQDTDPVQWQVIERAFVGHATVVLIGDPKQAIYAFRGGDVVTYLAAAATATRRATLGTNWRSDAALVERLQVVLRNAALGDEEITVREVRAAHEGSRLGALPHPEPFRLRAVARDGFRLTRAGDIPMRAVRDHIAADCAADIVGALASGATYDDRPLVAADVAVLVGTRDQGHLVQSELVARGVPAVLAGGGHVLLTPAADEMVALLEALDQPHQSRRVRAAALTSFFGMTTTDLDERGEDLTDEVADVLRGWALLLRGRGVAALFEAAEERGLTARVLGRTDGERLLTDLRHLAQLLHDVATRERLGLTALLHWLREERERNAPTSERTRRLDSDAAAVQIVTIHASKGLQYPLVYLPFVFEKFLHTVDQALFHDSGVRTLDVSGSGPQWSDHVARHRAEEAGEELRELYVALTRAQSQVVAWWAPTANTPDGGLHRLLFGRQPGQPAVPDRMPVKDDDYAHQVLRMIEELRGPAYERSVVADPPVVAPAAAPPSLAARVFDRAIDTDWRRTSYSGLIRVEESEPGVTSEPERRPLDDEPAELDDNEPAGPAAPVAEAPVSPMAELPAGAGFGSLVHAVLEHADPEAPDLRAELLDRVTEQLGWWPVDATPEAIADALVPLHHTPLGPLAAGLTLADLPLRDRLCELDFEFPLAGGDARGRTPRVLLGELAGLWRAHLPADDPLAPYAATLDRPLLGGQVLRGYLSGSIDVVLRASGPGGDPRFIVVDYKTNLLGEPGRPVTAADYGPAELAAAMLHSHYPLQAMLYSVVLHRFLRWRLPGYHPERHLGGVLYLYLRGMCGPASPVVDGHPSGVFSWSPPASLVTAVSDLLAGEGAS
ncbi:UvrD-helicase domain-containing protein [Nocardioides sp.]|uniref:UvrD-helicase domain-containing protein n=1 Tax=Nocardioides sp. TaxID=35761 RepID=UPI003526FD06